MRTTQRVSRAALAAAAAIVIGGSGARRPGHPDDQPRRPRPDRPGDARRTARKL